jgi:hypothetical protein
MSRYFILDCHPPLGADFYSHRVPEPAKSRRCLAGVQFTNADRREGLRLLHDIIPVETIDEPDAPLLIHGELRWVPIPLMSRRLVAGLQAAGVNNLQTFDTELVSPPGKTPPRRDHYLAVNIVGCMNAADLEKSETRTAVSETGTSMDFHSLAVDMEKTRGQLMFRLAENVSAVLVHESVKAALDAAGFTTLTWFDPKDWAG